MITNTQRMRNGEKIKCPKCEHGFFSAVGDPKTAKVFRCDDCQTSIVSRVPLEPNVNSRFHEVTKGENI